MHVARVYLRVSTQGQDLDRQESIIAEARDTGYYIAGVYRQQYQQDGEADRLQRSAGEVRLGSTSEGKREAGNVVAKLSSATVQKSVAKPSL
jgi:DNA invertase Pin-like site-specific DNA recombinase